MANFLIFKSSAGSGKTFNLVKEYIKLAIAMSDGQMSDFRSILAVTFTNKAAEEIKSRIIRALNDIVRQSDKNMAPIIQNELKNENINLSIEVIIQRSQQTLDQILHDYSRFSVGTIDSFFQKIVRSYARELNIPLSYNVDMDNAKALDWAIDRMMNELGENNPELTNWLEEFARYNLSQGLNWDLRKNIKSLGYELFKEEFQEIEPYLFTNQDLAEGKAKLFNFVQLLSNIISEIENQQNSIAEQALMIIEKRNIEFDELKGGEKGVFHHFKKIKQHNFAPTDTLKKMSDNNFSEETIWYSGKGKAKSKEIEGAVNDGLINLLDETVKHWIENETRYKTAINLIKNIYSFGLLIDLATKLKHFSIENETLLIAETNRIIENVVEKSDTPFIYEKVGNKYKHYLIDEFQDTSRFQWQNFKPLIENSLSEENKAMLVGDVKQAIYRWRGGDMRLLLHKVADDLQIFVSENTEVSLNKNYRSLPNVIKFNNTIFSSLFYAFEGTNEFKNISQIKNAYSDSIQKIKEDYENEGFVKVKFLNSENNEQDGSPFLSKKDLFLQKIYFITQKAKQDGFEYGDIAVLVRTNSEGVDVSDYLANEKNIQVVSAESLLLKKHPGVRVLINALYLLDNPLDKLRKAELLSDYLNYFSGNVDSQLKNEYLINAIFTNDETIFEKLLPAEFVNETRFLSFLPLYEMTEELVRRLGLNKKPDAYIQAFLDFVLNDFSTENRHLRAFLEFWEEKQNSLSVNLPENKDAVKILTIHKSKGLEFPVVIMPFVDFSFKAKSATQWVTTDEQPFNQFPFLPVNLVDQLAETHFANSYHYERQAYLLDVLNVLYVGFTRAAERLYVLATRPKEELLLAKMPVEKMSKANDLLVRIFSNTFNLNLTPENQKLLFDLSQYWDPIEGALTIGQEAPPTHETLLKNKENQRYSLENFACNRWRARLVVRPTSADVFEEDIENQSFNLNVLTRDILNELSSVNDLDKILIKHFYEGLFDRETASRLKNNIESILKDSLTNDWFNSNKKLYQNRQILLKNGKNIDMDRVVVDGKEATIVSFQIAIEIDKPIQSKLKKQALALKSMGFETVKSFVYLVNQQKAVEIAV